MNVLQHTFNRGSAMNKRQDDDGCYLVSFDFEAKYQLGNANVDDKVHVGPSPLERCKDLAIVRWNSKRGPEFTWEREDQFKKKYPHLFTKTTPSSSATS
ncbi:hypothetical protein Tco_1273826 [Tanacetum coccineum]